MYRHLGMNVVEFLRLLGGCFDEIDRLVSVSGEEHAREALSRGKGALALVSHVGNWEYLALSMARRFHPTGIIIKDIKKSDLNDYLVESREAQGINIFLRRGAYRACVRGLRENMFIGFVLDQNMRATEGAFVDFFGRDACTTLGLAHMAARSQCPIVPIFIERQPGGRHKVTVQPLLEPPASRDLEELEAATQLYTSIIEEAVRKNPEQWTWIHRRWRTTRPETAAVAEESGSAQVTV
jgi:KDO2-lipid IV(A) lauroyltransferase